MQSLKSFLFLRIITVSDGILFVLAGIWITMVILGLWSVFSSPRHLGVKFLWSLLILGIPLAGLLLYSLSCLFAADWAIITQMGFFSRSRQKITSSLDSSIPDVKQSQSP